MQISVGDDLVENERIRKSFDKFGKRFLDKVYTQEEQDYCLQKKDPIPHLSARFACKEAFIKAIGIAGDESMDMKEVELCGNYFGKKNMSLHGKALKLFQESGYDAFSVSISHTDNYSTAVVILYKR
jgi:holo-[acyl-carrier protein] synthase